MELGLFTKHRRIHNSAASVSIVCVHAAYIFTLWSENLRRADVRLLGARIFFNYADIAHWRAVERRIYRASGRL